MKAKANRRPTGTFGEKLAAQIESLQQAAARLSTSTSAKDLAARFRSVLESLYPSADITLLHIPADSENWEAFSDIAGSSPSKPSPSPESAGGIVAVLDKKRNGVRVVRRLPDGSAVGVFVRQTASSGSLTTVDLAALKFLVQIFDGAYSALLSRRTEKDLVFSLNHRVLQLNSLIDTGIEITKLVESIHPEQLALERAASLSNASKGAVTIRKGKEKVDEYHFPAIGLKASRTKAHHRIKSSFSFSGNTYTFELFDKESRAGIQPFEETDQVLLDALARQVHGSLENRHLHAQALEKQKIERDIAVAASIQQRILPRTLPTISGYDVAGINIPSKYVGGDYYDCIPLSNGTYAFVIADVAGKGVPAALLVSSLHAYLSAYLEAELPLLELARRLNRVIRHAATEDKYITAFFGILNPATGEFETLNAGHNPVYILRSNNSVEEIEAGGVPIGMLDMEFPYVSQQLTLQPGERVLLYTDGITEAANEHDVFYDTAVPLKDFFARQRSGTADAFIRDLITDIKKFTGAAPQNDDITALYLMRG